jgi:CHAT domain-containing protein
MPFRYNQIVWALLAAGILTAGPASAQVRSTPATGDQCAPEIERRIASLIPARKYDEVLAAAEEFGRVASARFGQESRCYASALAERAVALQLTGRLAEAGLLFDQALELFRKYAPADDPKLSLTLNNLGVYYYLMRQYPNAARAHEEALELRRRHKPLDEAAVAESLHNLADAYRYLRRAPGEVLKLYQKALEIKTRVLKPDDVSIGHTLQNLASAQEEEGSRDLPGALRHLEQALTLYRRALPRDDPRIAAVFNRQALVYFMQGNYREAEAKFREALRLLRASATTPKPTLAATLDDFSVNQMQLGQLGEAKQLAREALESRRAVFPENHLTIARTLSNLSYFALLDRNLDESLKLAREASDVAIANGGSDERSRLWLQRHLLAAWSAGARDGRSPPRTLADEAFIIGQRAIQSDTAATVLRTSLRFSASNAGLSALLKEVDDIDRELTGLELELTHSLTLASGQSAKAFSDIRAEMAAKGTRRKELLGNIETSFPDYARLVNPKPLSTASVQALLEPDEALVMVVVGYVDIHIWCVTREEAVWRKPDLRPQELEAIVQTLRVALDTEPEDTSANERTKRLFDLGLAYELYAKLLGPISPAIASKSSLIVVPSGPLTSLPLHLLVSGKPKPTREQALAYRDAEWLAKRFAISVLPSVESFEALRRRAKPTPDRKPMIGFADPWPSPDFVSPEKEQKIASAQRGLVRRAALRGGPAAAGIWATGIVDIEALRQHLARYPLESSKEELMSVGKALGADPRDLLTGPQATETAVKHANLASYRVVYFATHGFVAGDFRQAEPSLALTVPKQPDEFDDGLLTASEIAQLTLDADWVILSACNTAAGTTKGAEGLSGLARAFFHAGARALIVSHWEADDLSATAMMTDMFGRLGDDRRVRRSEAFRQAMLSQIRNAGKKDTLWDAYPGRWAVFEMVGVD